MKPTCHGLKIVWGFGEAPTFPEGWTLRRNLELFCVAVSPDGKEYLIGDGVLYPWMTRKVGDKFGPVGQRYLDTDNKIPIPA